MTRPRGTNIKEEGYFAKMFEEGTKEVSVLGL